MCELESRALERPGKGWRPPGPRPPRPRANSWSCCCSGSQLPPRLWPATLRWGPGERPSPFSCARGGARPAGGRAAGSGPGGGRGALGGGGGPALRRVWSASPARPGLAQCLALEVGLSPPPQRPNERHRGCGGQRAASASPASIPPAARPHPLRTLRSPDSHSAVPRDRASLCRAPCSPGPGAARLAPGSALPTRPPVGRLGFPPGSGGCGLCWRVGRAAGMRAPGQSLPDGTGAGPLPAAGAPSASCAPPALDPALASDLREGLLNTIRLPESDEPGETLLRCRRCSLLWWVSASRDSTREYVVKTLVEAYFFGVSSFPAPGDLANTHVCAGRWSGACVPGRFAGVRGSCLVAWAWPLVETFLSTRETWNFIFTWHLEIVLELSDWNVCFWCSLFPLFALLQITMAFCGVG